MKPKGAGRPRPLTPKEIAQLTQFLGRLKVDTWDALVIGDGSGLRWDAECAIGWASVVIERATLSRRIFTGSMDYGTVNIAEIMAFLQPLTYLAGREQDRVNQVGVVLPCRVHIVTDSDYCCTTGNSQGGGSGKNAGFWGAVQATRRSGLILRWHWMKRNTTGWHAYCDALSKLAREHSKGCNIPKQYLTKAK